MTLAVDMSNHSGPLSSQEAACLRSEGVGTVIVATGPGPGQGYLYGEQTVQQAQTVLDASLSLESYHFLEWGRDPAQWIRWGVETLGPLASRAVRSWVNVEHTANVPATLAERINYVERAFAEADRLYPGRPVGLCTGRWFWTDSRYMQNTSHFASRQLWNANYDDDPDIDGLPYGGWTRASVAIEQYRGTHTLCSQSVDADWIYIPASPAVPPPPALSELDALLLSVWAVPADHPLPLAERLAKARWRMQQAIMGATSDYLPIEGSVIYLDDRITKHTHPGGGAAHTHVTGPAVPAIALDAAPIDPESPPAST